MKKLTFVIAVVFVLSGCGQQNVPENMPEESAPPAVTPQPQQKNAPEEELRSSFKTAVLDNSEGRIHNINLSINAINGKILAPGEVFSFNETVGERTPERGYKKAKVLLEGEYVLDYGGGVCQVSTTIYNAALAAGLEITEHHNHKKPVSYIAEGRDAAVNYGTLDLKVKNNTNLNIRIDVSQGNSEIYANIVQIK